MCMRMRKQASNQPHLGGDSATISLSVSALIRSILVQVTCFYSLPATYFRRPCLSTPRAHVHTFKVLSTKRSHNGVGFGTGSRPDLLVQSTADVGPGEYTVPGTTGERQVRVAGDLCENPQKSTESPHDGPCRDYSTLNPHYFMLRIRQAKYPGHHCTHTTQPQLHRSLVPSRPRLL